MTQSSHVDHTLVIFIVGIWMWHFFICICSITIVVCFTTATATTTTSSSGGRYHRGYCDRTGSDVDHRNKDNGDGGKESDRSPTTSPITTSTKHLVTSSECQVLLESLASRKNIGMCVLHAIKSSYISFLVCCGFSTWILCLTKNERICDSMNLYYQYCTNHYTFWEW